jgi:energy-coupling factor transport system ATP-binding protein
MPRGEALRWNRSRISHVWGNAGRGRESDFIAGKKKARQLYRLEGVSAGYSGESVLKNLSLEINSGTNTAILGENGSGKTTLLRLLGGLMKPMEGKISRGAEIGRKKSIRAGYVFQNPGRQLFMDTVLREIEYLAENDNTAGWIIKIFGLGSIAGRHPLSLSEGQKRVVTVAAAASVLPAVMLLDEPTVGQDSAGLHRLFTAIAEVRDRAGTVLVFTTHDYRAAAALAERTIILRDGEIFRTGGCEAAEEYFMS